MSPSIGNIFLCSLVIGIAATTLYVYTNLSANGQDGNRARLKELTWKEKKSIIFQTSLSALIVAVVLCIFGTVALLVMPGPYQMVIDGNLNILTVFEKEETMWTWDSRLSAGNLVNYDITPMVYESMTASPITENPKVRKLRYTVRVNTNLTPNGYLQKVKNFNDESRLRYLLYEFNEFHSKELAKFYNPLDLNQQKTFEELVKNFVFSKIADHSALVINAQFVLDD